jgi:hypothetical protein
MPDASPPSLLEEPFAAKIVLVHTGVDHGALGP